MSTTHESNESKKAMAYDLFQIMEEENAREPKTYTMEDIKTMIKNYITASTGNS